MSRDLDRIDDVDKLRPLIDEYVAALDLEEHDNVATLAINLCSLIVNIFDSYIKSQRQDKITPESKSAQEAAQIIKEICRRLRERGEVASRYAQLLDFVRLKVRPIQPNSDGLHREAIY